MALTAEPRSVLGSARDPLGCPGANGFAADVWKAPTHPTLQSCQRARHTNCGCCRVEPAFALSIARCPQTLRDGLPHTSGLKSDFKSLVRLGPATQNNRETLLRLWPINEVPWMRKEIRMRSLRQVWQLALFTIVHVCGYSLHCASVAQTCESEYIIKQGETLADISARAYGTPLQWTLIFNANQDRMGANASMLVPGLSIRLPCLGGQLPAQKTETITLPSSSSAPPSGSEIEVSSVVRRLEFLTADGYPPFTDRSLPNGGIMTHLVTASMDLIKEKAGGSFGYNVSWVNDRAAHLNPLLSTLAFDVGFPWLKPDCDKPADLPQDAKYRCQKFFFSDPIYEVFTVLFVKSNSTIAFAKDDEIIGKTLCQPAGYSTYELDKGGRNWMRDNKVLLLRPQTFEECFRLLDGGNVTAVVTSDLAGKAAIAALGLRNRVRPLQRPLAIGTFHLIVPKTHPNASTVLYYVNSALAKLRDSGEYDKIIDSHLSRFWTAQERN
jgi:polar amino acid transport system substrate-binding protein